MRCLDASCLFSQLAVDTRARPWVATMALFSSFHRNSSNSSRVSPAVLLLLLASANSGQSSQPAVSNVAPSYAGSFADLSCSLVLSSPIRRTVIAATPAATTPVAFVARHWKYGGAFYGMRKAPRRSRTSSFSPITTINMVGRGGRGGSGGSGGGREGEGGGAGRRDRGFNVERTSEERYGAYDQDRYDRRPDYYDEDTERGGGRGGRRVGGYGDARGGGGRRGHFTDGRGGGSLQSKRFPRGGRGSQYGHQSRSGHVGRGRGRGRGRYQEEDSDYARRNDDRYNDGGDGRRGDAGMGPVEGTGSGVWGYEDDEDVVFSRNGAGAGGVSEVDDGALPPGVAEDDGSGGSRAGPVDREHFYSIKPLPDIGANEVAVKALNSLGIMRPSKIQAISYKTVLSGQHCLVADQTGSGKTLAYLAPLVQRLRLEELAKDQGRAAPGRPRVLILAPTAELAQQVQGVAQLLSATIPFRSCCFTGGAGRSFKTQAKLLQEGVDVLVATPGRVSTLLEAEALNLEDCRAVVLDEVDVLFMDETFKLAPIGTCAPEDTQFIFVTATLPQSVSNMVKIEFPGTKFLLGPGLHRVAPGVEEVLIDCSGPPDEPKNEETGLLRKREALLRQLERRMALRTLVFCNTINACRQVENILNRASRRGQFQTLVYHSAIDPKQAADNIRQFMRSNAVSPMVMVCTDRSSRGMDFDRAEVEHVLLYDFPRDPIEYMRRVGRTARAGRKGVVTVLAWGRQVPLVREIMAGNKRGKRLLSLDD